MALAAMIARDEDAVFCDLWETYGVRDYKALPPTVAARLFCGLRENSRCRMILSGKNVDTPTILLAAAVDRLGVLAWMNSEAARKGGDRPPSIVDAILNVSAERDIEVFDTGEAFEAARAKIIREGGGAYE